MDAPSLFDLIPSKGAQSRRGPPVLIVPSAASRGSCGQPMNTVT